MNNQSLKSIAYYLLGGIISFSWIDYYISNFKISPKYFYRFVDLWLSWSNSVKSNKWPWNLSLSKLVLNGILVLVLR